MFNFQVRSVCFEGCVMINLDMIKIKIKILVRLSEFGQKNPVACDCC